MPATGNLSKYVLTSAQASRLYPISRSQLVLLCQCGVIHAWREDNEEIPPQYRPWMLYSPSLASYLGCEVITSDGEKIKRGAVHASSAS